MTVNSYRRWHFLLAISLIVVMLVGCSKGANNSNNPSNSGSVPNNNSSNNEEGTPETEKFEDVTLKVLIDWNGSEASGPKDPINNPVAKVIKEKTGVTLDMQYAKMDEIEQLNTIFATQELPDIVDAPAWLMEPLVKAAKEGQMMDITEILEQYPVLKTNQDADHTPIGYQENLFNVVPGKKFFTYGGYPATADDITDWLYGLYVRKDVAEQTGIDPTTVHTPDELYNFLKKIKDLNLKQDGKTIYPLGSFQGGWWVQYINKMFMYNNTEYNWDSGAAQYQYMSDKYTEATLYFRKLISEGLLDPEAFSQTATVANEKAAQGRSAVLTGHYFHITGAVETFVASHPEAEFVPLGPLNDVNGDPFKAETSASGAHAVFLTKANKNPEASARLLNFLASDEGWLLTNYGVEGIHYDMVDGKPVAKQEWLDKEAATPGTLKDEGFGTNLPYSYLAGQNRTVSLFGGPYGWQSDKKYQKVLDIKKVVRPNGLELVKGDDIGQVTQKFSGIEKLKPVMEQLGLIWQQAIYAKSDEAAIKLLDNARKELEKAGIHDLEKYLDEQAKTLNFIKNVNG